MAMAHWGTLDACFRRLVFPAMVAGAAKRRTCQKGKFQGITARITPRGLYAISSLMHRTPATAQRETLWHFLHSNRKQVRTFQFRQCHPSLVFPFRESWFLPVPLFAPEAVHQAL